MEQLLEITPGSTSLFPARAAALCLLITSESHAFGHYSASVTWMCFGVEQQQEPGWHSGLSQHLFCKQGSPPTFLIYKQHS